VTPQFDYGVPFWGKPPLHTWLSAAGMKLFGINHLGARIFIFLTALLTLWMLYRWTKDYAGRDYALLGTTILASSGLFYLASATVMTDLVLVTGTTMSMIGFYTAFHDMPRSRLWGYLFFVGLAIGMLAKGPVAVVLTALPIFLWVLLGNHWLATWKRLPWLSGTLLAIAIFLPWYLIAEMQTPGFLRYFIVGEHFERFLTSGWDGDLYGNGHSEPKGTIWLFFLLAMLPWTFFLLFPLIRGRALVARIRREENAWTFYLISWALSPLLFFTFASNIIATYVFTGIPATCYLAVDLWKMSGAEKAPPSRGMRRFFLGSLLATLAIAGTALVLFMSAGGGAPKKSQMYLVAKSEQLRSADSGPLHYWHKRYYSADFYTGGKSQILQEEADLQKIVASPTRDFLVVRKSHRDEIPPAILDTFRLVAPFGKDELYYEKPRQPQDNLVENQHD
jgi:4-amino-4-deoxy-L-arabinose transferase-like glycosyltransferase